MNTKTQKVVISAMLCALCCVATMLIKIPSPMKGYINLGDCVVLLCGWILPPLYGFLAAGMGSALADIFSGYLIYAPATFVIKGIMAFMAFYTFKLLKDKIKEMPSRIISGIISEIFMVLGYLLFESCLYGFVPSIINVPANLIQGIAGLIFGIVLIQIFEKNRIFI